MTISTVPLKYATLLPLCGQVVNKRKEYDEDILYGEEDNPSVDADPKRAW